MTQEKTLQYRCHTKAGRLEVAGVVFTTVPALYEMTTGEANMLQRKWGDRLLIEQFEDPEPEASQEEPIAESSDDSGTEATTGEPEKQEEPASEPDAVPQSESSEPAAATEPPKPASTRASRSTRKG